MPDFNIQEFKKNVSDGNKEAATQLVLDYVNNSMTPEERGGALVSLMQAYMEATKEADASYNAILQDAIASLNQLNANENAAADKMKLDETRSKLGA